MDWLKNLDTAVVGVFSVTLMTMVFFGLRQGVDLDKRLTRLTGVLMWATIVTISVDTVVWLIDGLTGPSARTIVMVGSSLGDMLMPLPPILWYLTAVYMVERERAFVSWRISLLAVTYGAVIGLVLTNPFTRLLFTLDAGNHYVRGPLYFLIGGTSYTFLLLTALLVYRHRSEYSFSVMAAQYFWVPPLIAGVVQTLFYGVNLSVPSMALCGLAFHSGLVARTTRLDYLTGVHTRRFLDALLHAKVHREAFSAIMIDVDQFKAINDQYGHAVGDEVLIGVASALKMSVRQNDCVARFGGDEFVLVIDSPRPSALDAVKRRIDLMLAQYNENCEYPFAVSLSMGCDFCQPQQHRSAQQLLAHVDRLMYAIKNGKQQELALKQPA